ncbi:MAG: class I SAM-dependent methyltransferase [Candidatus Babeliales bacterium]
MKNLKLINRIKNFISVLLFLLLCYHVKLKGNMINQNSNQIDTSSVVKEYYLQGGEAERLSNGIWQIEKARTENILHRFLPKSPATIVDVGGAAGAYALPLAKQGYEVYLIDLVPLHIEQAKKAEKLQSDHSLKACIVGDARKIELSDSMTDVVLLMGPLYHLPDKKDRLMTISEAYRILKPGGLLFAVGISRFASFIDGIIYRTLKDPIWHKIIVEDIKTGHHVNPTQKFQYFTTSFFHKPDELKEELELTGFKKISILAIEGLGFLMPDFDKRWKDQEERKILMSLLEMTESDPNMLAASSHIMAIGKKE